MWADTLLVVWLYHVNCQRCLRSWNRSETVVSQIWRRARGEMKVLPRWPLWGFPMISSTVGIYRSSYLYLTNVWDTNWLTFKYQNASQLANGVYFPSQFSALRLEGTDWGEMKEMAILLQFLLLSLLKPHLLQSDASQHNKLLSGEKTRRLVSRVFQ